MSRHGVWERRAICPGCATHGALKENTMHKHDPGCTEEHCIDCGAPTGRAGRGDDSLYIDEDGPFCEGCFQKWEQMAQAEYANSI